MPMLRFIRTVTTTVYRRTLGWLTAPAAPPVVDQIPWLKRRSPEEPIYDQPQSRRAWWVGPQPAYLESLNWLRRRYPEEPQYDQPQEKQTGWSYGPQPSYLD